MTTREEVSRGAVRKVLIIEDTPNDISYYLPLFDIGKEVHLLFLAREQSFTEEKLVGLIELLYENIAPKIAGYHMREEDEIVDFLKNNQFDFYVSDSLGGSGVTLVGEAGLSKDTVAFLSSTTSFRELAWDKGYRAYKKDNMHELINDCLIERQRRK